MPRILIIGFGLDINRREAVSVNVNHLVKDLRKLGFSPYILSLGYKQKEYGSTLVGAILHRKQIISRIADYIENHKIDTVLDVFVLPLASTLFTFPLITALPHVRFIKEVHNLAGNSRHVTVETIIRLVANRQTQLTKVLSAFDYAYSRNLYVSRQLDITYLPPTIDKVKTQRVRQTAIIRACYLGHPLKKKGIYEFLTIFRLMGNLLKQDVKFAFALSPIGPTLLVRRLLQISAWWYGVTIELTGKVKPSQFFRAHDIYILPIQDMYGAVSTPNTILEAMEAGCVVMVAKLESLQGIVHQKNSVLLGRPVASEIVSNLKKITFIQLKRLATVARSDIMTKFSSKKHIVVLKQIYDPKKHRANSHILH